MKHARAEGEPPQQPQPVVVEKGDLLTVAAYYGEAGLGMQFRVSTVVRTTLPGLGFVCGRLQGCLVRRGAGEGCGWGAGAGAKKRRRALNGRAGQLLRDVASSSDSNGHT